MTHENTPEMQLIRQGLEQQLVHLEELRFDFIGESDDNVPQVCATCYIEKEECICEAPVYWPLPAVIYKLRVDLKTGMEANGT